MSKICLRSHVGQQILCTARRDSALQFCKSVNIFCSIYVKFLLYFALNLSFPLYMFIPQSLSPCSLKCAINSEV